ncbi:MAG TPA: tetratricopeptide repeat protein [Candidatus Krumholzibacteria bacterium]|nr:tetratricopeptide repeat protein [Candidatus Krumholzibacteria bacterium]
MRTALLLLPLLLAPVTAAAAVPPEALWTARATESYLLEAGESVQFQVGFDSLPVRAWILEVDGDQRLCDLNVLRRPDDVLIDQKNRESRHRVRVPWGRGQEITATLTADAAAGGVYTVKFLAPSPEEAGQAYGFLLNRALDALDAGDPTRAEGFLQQARRDDEDLAEADLLLAGIRLQRGEPREAAGLLDDALDAGLDDPWTRADVLRRAGRAHHEAGALVRAQERLDQAVAAAVDAPQRALALYRAGLLQRDRGNPAQARLALTTALHLGLPADLADAAAAALRDLPPEE